MSALLRIGKNIAIGIGVMVFGVAFVVMSIWLLLFIISRIPSPFPIEPMTHVPQHSETPPT